MLLGQEQEVFLVSLADHVQKIRYVTTCRIVTAFVNQSAGVIVLDQMKALQHRQQIRIPAWINQISHLLLLLHRKLRARIIILIYTVMMLQSRQFQIIAENQLFLFLHLGFGALAALKRKRKKFSRSRNTSPILEPPHSQEADSSSAVCDGHFL